LGVFILCSGCKSTAFSSEPAQLGLVDLFFDFAFSDFKLSMQD
jgi:hypothetical protein